VQKRCRACSLQPLSSGKKSAGKLLRARGLKSLGLHGGVRAFFVGAEVLLDVVDCCRRRERPQKPSVGLTGLKLPMFSLSFVPTTSSCQGYGARFEQRVNSLPPSITSAPSAEHKAAYSSFVTTTLQGFSGASLIQSSNRQAFAAEAEHWVQRAFTSSPSSLMVRTSEALLNSTNESSASKALKTNGSTAHSEAAPLELTLTSVARPALSCLSHLYQLLVGKVDMRPQSFIAEPQSGGAPQNGLILLSGGDRVAALSEAVVENHRQFARTHGYVHWFHKGSMVASLGWLPYW
jgi:hypothetical protein